jgi:hypothetical protein
VSDQKQREQDEPTVANGIDNDEELDEKATEEEISKGNFTRVVSLVNNEVEPD